MGFVSKSEPQYQTVDCRFDAGPSRYREPAMRASNFRNLILAVLLAVCPAVAAHAAIRLGANKFDLLMQYQGFASSGNGSPGYSKVTKAMGRKAILDAHDTGLAFLRVNVSGFHPVTPKDTTPDALGLWQKDPRAYWRSVDVMLDDLDRAHIRLVPTLIWNIVQFPAAANETLTDFIAKPTSASRALAMRFITDFVSRYRGRQTILFYELSNEFNLQADLDMVRHCHDEHSPDPAHCDSYGNFTSDQLGGFAHDMAALVHRLDPLHPLSSGYSAPRVSAFHLARHPEWSQKGPDWTVDSPEEFDRVLTTTQQDFDIVSIHIYPADEPRFGQKPSDPLATVTEASRVVHAAGKKLFVGEFGDETASPFMQGMVRLAAEGQIDFAAVWIWEFYQFSTTRSFDTPASRTSLEPGHGDDVIALLRQPLAATNPSSLPRVVLTWPLPCARLDQPLTLSAVASDGDKAANRVEFYIDGTAVGRSSVPPYTAQFDPRAFGSKEVEIKAVATGRNGAASDTSPVLLNGANTACVVPNN